MSIAALKYISDTLSGLKINYQFGEWTTNPVPDPYFVGEYTEIDSQTKEENGYQETSFLLTGTGTTWLTLETAKETIENALPIETLLPNGEAIAIYYAGALTVPTGDATLKRIQINLTVKEWRAK